MAALQLDAYAVTDERHFIFCKYSFIRKYMDAFKSVLPHIKPETIIVNVAKGIEQKNLMKLSEICIFSCSMYRPR